MRVPLSLTALLLSGGTLFLSCAAFQTGPSQPPTHPGFKPTPEQNPMPKNLLVVKRTDIERARYPAIDSDEVLMKIYYRNALRYLLSLRQSIETTTGQPVAAAPRTVIV